MSQNKVGQPLKYKLDYYRLQPMKKLRRTIILKYGHNGHTMFTELLLYIVSTDGYYFNYQKDSIDDFLIDSGFSGSDRKMFEAIVKTLLQNDVFFNSDLFKNHKILSNYDFQEGYIKGTKRRKVLSMILQYILPEMSDVLTAYRKSENNEIRKWQINNSKLYEVRWLRLEDKQLEEHRKRLEKERQSDNFQQENYWTIPENHENEKIKGLPINENLKSQSIESEADNVISVNIYSENVDNELTSTNTRKDKLSKVKISEAKQSDSFGNVPFPNSKESTTLVTPSKNSDEKLNTEKKKTDPFVLVIRECYTEWTGIPYMNRSLDENRAIKEISKSLVAIIKAQNPDNELNDEQICGQLKRVCGIIFNSKNREKLPDHIKKSSEYVTIAKYLNTIITQLVPLNSPKAGQQPVHRPAPIQNSPRTGQIQSISEVFGPQIIEKEPTFQHEKMEISQYTAEKLEEMGEEELLEHYQKALTGKQSFLSEMLLNVMKQKGFINSQSN